MSNEHSCPFDYGEIKQFYIRRPGYRAAGLYICLECGRMWSHPPSRWNKTTIAEIDPTLLAEVLE